MRAIAASLGLRTASAHQPSVLARALTILSPVARAAPQLLRFALSGGIVAAFMFTAMAVLVGVLGAHPQAALAPVYAVAVALNFALNRQFVFRSRHGYALRLSRQGIAYLVVAAASYGLTALGLAVLPGLLGVDPLVAYFITAAALALVFFVVLRRFVFRWAER